MLIEAISSSLTLHPTRDGPLNRRDAGVYVDAVIRRVASDADFEKTGSFQSALQCAKIIARVKRPAAAG
ncbi:MAG: hypothetical protein WC765_10225 [Phycisphaerae bacterium]|jgi:hypothetical protein